MQGVVKTVGTMAERQFQIALDRPNADLKSRRNLARRLAFNGDAAEHFARPRRQFGQRPLEGFYLGTRFNYSRRIWVVVANVQQRIDLRRTHAIVLGLLPVLRDIDGCAENIIGRTANRYGVRHAIQPQECLVQGVVGKIRRSQATRKLPDEPVVVLDQLSAQPNSIAVSHVSQAPNTLPSFRSPPDDQQVVAALNYTFMTGRNTTYERTSNANSRRQRWSRKQNNSIPPTKGWSGRIEYQLHVNV
jgi:hypothetical protein